MRATGRERAGPVNDAIRDHGDLTPAASLPHANNTHAVRTYTEEYEYDLLGNITTLHHRFKNQMGIGTGWTRRYRYAHEDDPTDVTNRLTATSAPGDPDGGPYSHTYDHDVYGHMTRMPHLAVMDWDALEQLRHLDLGGGGDAWYVYGAGGQRLRKVVDRIGNLQLDWIYLGPVMLFRRRRRDSGVIELERWTVHIGDSVGPIVCADTKTVDPDDSDPDNPLDVPLLRYQHGNLIGCAGIETDADGAVVSYEETHPYGTSAYRSARPGYDLSLKRYRFSGKERDDESGLQYFGARYYANWLGRWTSANPAGFADGLNLYRYCRNSPINLRDRNGLRGGPNQQRFEYRVQMPHFTGGENPSVADFKKFLSIDPRINDRNASIMYLPKGRLDLESGSFIDEPGGTWVLSATFTVPPPRRRTAARRPPAPPPPEPPAPPPAAQAEPTVESPPTAPEAPPAATAPQPSGSPASGGAAATHTAPAAEKFIWHHRFRREGLPGTQRGRILEWLYGNQWRSNTKDYDIETLNDVRQIKSTHAYGDIGQTTRDATRDASKAVRRNPTGTMTGKQPRAVIITPTDAPAKAGTDIAGALGRVRKPIPNAAAPQHIRGLPGPAGVGGRALTGVGLGLSIWALGTDIANGDVPMGIGDALGVIGGGLEVAAIAVPGLAIAGVSAMTIGLAVGGLGIAITSGVSGYRALEAGDTAGAVAGGVGVAAGLAITAGAIGIVAGVAAAPVLLVGGIVAAIGVGIFHAGRYFDWW